MTANEQRKKGILWCLEREAPREKNTKRIGEAQKIFSFLTAVGKGGPTGRRAPQHEAIQKCEIGTQIQTYTRKHIQHKEHYNGPLFKFYKETKRRADYNAPYVTCARQNYHEIN